MKIKRPTLILDEKKCKANIQRMLEKAQRSNTIFRPHFKTHQSHQIGRWFKDFDIDKIAVSSVQMAQYFANDGWRDISIAFPVNLREIDEINALNQNVRLNVLIESKNILEKLEDLVQEEIGVFVKIDTGYHRTGIRVEDEQYISELMKQFSVTKRCEFKGFLVHNGQTYKAKTIAEIKEIHRLSLEKLLTLKEKYITQFPDLIFSMGDTPSMSVLDDFSGVDEIRPGNFVFYDLMQSDLGVCAEEDIAVAMACPVVAKHKDRNQLVIYGGGVHLSKESIQIDGQAVFGKMVFLKESKWEIPEKPFYLVSLSQEHGIIQLDDELIHNISLGDIVGVLPVHSCLTADLQKNYLTFDKRKIPKV